MDAVADPETTRWKGAMNHGIHADTFGYHIYITRFMTVRGKVHIWLTTGSASMICVLLLCSDPRFCIAFAVCQTETSELNKRLPGLNATRLADVADDYRSDTVNSKSSIGNFLLQIQWKFKLEHEDVVLPFNF